MAQHDLEPEIWITETGYSTWRYDELNQIDCLLATLEAPVARIYWYGYQDLHPSQPSQEGWHFDKRHYHFGLVTAGGQPKLLHRVLTEGGIAFARKIHALQRKAPALTGRARPAIITGGAGFLGCNLADRLAAENQDVLIVDGLVRAGVENNLAWLRRRHPKRISAEIADVRDPYVINHLVHDAGAVFHLAAQVAVTTSLADPMTDFEVNALGTLHLLEALRKTAAADAVCQHQQGLRQARRCCSSTTPTTAPWPRPEDMARSTLEGYDGVLAFGAVLREIYLERGWARAGLDLARGGRRAASSARCPGAEGARPGLDRQLGRRRAHGGAATSFCSSPIERARPRRRGPRRALSRRPRCAALASRASSIRGWLPNTGCRRPSPRHRATVHVPRRPYVEALPGIPTIRMFEALACGIPLVWAPWRDVEGLFRPARTFSSRRDGEAMRGPAARGPRGPRAGRAPRRAAACAPSASGTPAGTGSTSCSRFCRRARAPPRSTHRATRCGRRSHEDRVLRIEPLSAYWNGAATYYRGILKALAARGHEITFYEPDAFERQQHRDIETAGLGARSSSTRRPRRGSSALERAPRRRLVVKASGVGVFDDDARGGRARPHRAGALAAFWDVDAPATLDAHRGATRTTRCARCFPSYDAVFTYGGGDRGVAAPIAAFGARPLRARSTTPLDPDDASSRSPPDAALRVPISPSSATACRTARRGSTSSSSTRAAPAGRSFLLGGSGWERQADAGERPPLGHVSTRDHNAFNCTPAAVLNISRDSMAPNGFSPPTRVFEAAGAGACLITDAWEGIEMFLEPGEEVLVAEDGADGRELLRGARRRSAPADRPPRRAAACWPSTPTPIARSRSTRCSHGAAIGAAESGADGAMPPRDRLPRPVDHLVLGQRPRDDLPGAARGARARAATR